MWIERLMAGISYQHVLSYNPKNESFFMRPVAYGYNNSCITQTKLFSAY